MYVILYSAIVLCKSDALTSYGEEAFFSDAYGNILGFGEYEFLWQAGKLAGAESSDYTISYTYNDEGLRIGKTVNGVEHRYVMIGTQLISEIFGAEIVTYFYDASGRPIGMRYMNTDDSFALEYYFYFELNIFGDIVAVYDEEYNKILSYSYDAWGNFTTTVHTTDTEKAYKAQCNSLTYRGYYYDRETNLYYLQTRYYSPELCRFISADSVDYLDPESITGLNLFAYCGNDPVNFVDPSGRWLETVFDLFSLGASVVEVVINPANPWAWAGLVGDAVDLLPFVTMVGEGIRAAKMVKYADDVIDASHDTIKFIKAADMVDDFSDSGTMLRRVGNLNDYRTLTKTTHVDGTNLHTLFMGNGKTIANTRKRVDGINEITESIFELKPYNLHSARRGVKQIINYNNLLGGGFKMIIVLY